MATLHIENVVRDFDSWIVAFDKFEAFRAQRGVRAYRLGRSLADPSRVVIDLDFASVSDATEFKAVLEQIWQTPQSKAELVSHGTPEVFDLVADRTLT